MPPLRSTMEPVERIKSLVDEETAAAVALRRSLHQHPEVAWQEFRSTKEVAALLAEAGLQPRIREEGTGLTVEVGPGRGPSVVFRGDLDALPITENNRVPYASEVPGVMHACGHDAHAAIAAGIARVLSRIDDLPGRARIAFQPAEETVPGGATSLIADGVLKNASAIMAFHVDPSIPPGTVGVRAGPITGASDRLRVLLTGPGGHTSRPHLTVDLVRAAAALADTLPSLLQQSVDPAHQVVTVFGRISGGEAENVIPTHVELAGTVRLFDLETWRSLPATVERLVHEIAGPSGAAITIDYERGSPPVLNDPDIIEVLRAAAGEALGPDAVLSTHRSMGSEDFAWYLESVPGAMLRLGAALPDRRTDLHAADFDIDERAIGTGILAGTVCLLRLMETRAARP
jgi:amidohydrolase